MRTISNGIKRIVKKAGIDKRLNHKALRKTFATFLYSQGVDIYQISKLLHHSTPRVTIKHYAKMLRTPYTGVTNKISEVIERAG